MRIGGLATVPATTLFINRAGVVDVAAYRRAVGTEGEAVGLAVFANAVVVAAVPLTAAIDVASRFDITITRTSP